MSEIYLGRIVSIGMTPDGRRCALYRVSSRSFPNRMASPHDDGQGVAIVPKPGHEGDVYASPYIAYNCARVIGETAVATNGSQTDPIAEKIAAGMPIRDALILSLAALDYEKDKYDTPRIAAVVRRGEELGWLGVVRKDGLDVRAFPLRPGRCLHCSTYEHNVPREEYESDFEPDSARAACETILGKGAFASFSNPVSAVCLLETDSGFEVAALDATA